MCHRSLAWLQGREDAVYDFLIAAIGLHLLQRVGNFRHHDQVMINLIKAADPQHFPIVYTLIGIYQTALCRQLDCFDPDANALECLCGDNVHEPLLVGRVQWCIPGGVQDDGCFFFRVNRV